MRRALLVLALLVLWAPAAHGMKLNLLQGQTCANSAPRPCLVDIFIQDSSSTVGAGLPGLTSGSAGLVCYYARSDQGNAAATQHTLGAATRGTWSATSNFVEKDATNMPGLYELSLITGMLAANATSVVVQCKGATNMAPMVLEIALVNYDPQNATSLGLTNLDATVSSRMATFTLPTNFSLFSIDGSGRVDLGKWVGVAPSALTSGLVQTDVERWLTGVPPAVSVTGVPKVDVQDWVGGAVPAVTVTGVPLVDLKYTLGTISPAAAGSVRADQVTGAVGSVTAGVTVSTNNDKTGYTITTNNDKSGYSLTQAFPANFATLAIDANGRVKIQAYLQKNTAALKFPYIMTDATTHAPKTGLAATTTCTRSIDGVAAGVGTIANIAETDHGGYVLDLGAGDVNGNTIKLRCSEATADDALVTIYTFP